MSRILQFWCNLNTRKIVKTCRFCFLRDYYGDSLDVMIRGHSFSKYAKFFEKLTFLTP